MYINFIDNGIFSFFFLLQYSIWRKYISSEVLTCPVLSWIYRATDVCHQSSYSLVPLVESVLWQYSCAIKWTINWSLRFVPIFSAFIVPFVCLFKKPLAEGTSSFTAKSKNSLQLQWDSQPCLYLGHHPVELFQHSQVPCKNTQSNNVTDPPSFSFQYKSDMSASWRHFSAPGRAAPVWVVQQWCQWCQWCDLWG